MHFNLMAVTFSNWASVPMFLKAHLKWMSDTFPWMTRADILESLVANMVDFYSNKGFLAKMEDTIVDYQHPTKIPYFGSSSLNLGFIDHLAAYRKNYTNTPIQVKVAKIFKMVKKS